jgi:DNA polymerase
MMDGHSPETLVSLLAWYREMGVDTAVAEAPTDWLMRGEDGPGRNFRVAGEDAIAPTPASREMPTRAASSAPPKTASRVSAPVSASALPAHRFPTDAPDVAISQARALAEAAADMAALEKALRQFEGCALKATAKNLCFWRGAAQARVFIVGDIPRRDDDLEGKPFVGPDGRLLDKILAAAGIDGSDIHLTNIVYWRPPGNRAATPHEMQLCRPFLDRQLALVRPDIVVALGEAAAKYLFQANEPITKMRGRWRALDVAGRSVKAMATLHPDFLIKSPAQKRQAWRDFLAVRVALDEARITSPA